MNDPHQSFRPIPTWMWLFALLSIGAFSSLLYYLDQYEKGNINSNQVSEIKKIFSRAADTQVQNTKKPQEENNKKPNFEFYSLLRDLEVVVPESELHTESSPAIADTKSPDTTSTSPDLTASLTTPRSEKYPAPATVGPKYYLQSGSFKQYEAADRMKANLALLGVIAHIESVNIPNSGTWHRVRVGPFGDKQEMGKLRNLLKANAIDSIMIKLKI